MDKLKQKPRDLNLSGRISKIRWMVKFQRNFKHMVKTFVQIIMSSTIVGRDDTIMLKKIEMPKFERFDNIIKKGRYFASKKGIKPEDVSTAIDEYRKEKNR